MSSMTIGTSAQRWGALWGDRPQAWAVTEQQQTPVYERTLEFLPVGRGTRVLDVGCGTGVFLELCAERGATVTGLDAAERLLALARTRVVDAELCLGDLQVLPYDDDSFDVVTGFTSFFFADEMVAALSEARRVARPGAPVAIQVFGAPERCDLEAMKAAVAAFRPPAPDGGAPEAYWRPGLAEALATDAGLVVERAFDCTWPYVYGDDEALLEAMLAAGGAGAIAGPEREPELRDAILRALAPCRQADGSYRVQNEWHVVITRA